MKNAWVLAMALSAAAVAGEPDAQAKPDEQASSSSGDAGTAAPSDAPSDAPDATVAAAPPSDTQLVEEDLGVPQQAVVARGPTQGRPLTVRRGFYTDTNLGTFFTLGGNDLYSNAQTYVQLGVGYDLFEILAVGVHVGFGSNAFNCFAGRASQGGPCLQSDAFTVTFFDGSLAYLHRLGDRFYLAPKVVAGWTLMDPAPLEGKTRGVNVGAGIGVEYATSMDHFTIGADVLARYILGANIPTIAIYPRVKYTF